MSNPRPPRMSRAPDGERPHRVARHLSLRATPLWAREVVLIGIVYGFYEVVRGLQHSAPAVAARHGWDILHWERAVDLDPESLLTRALVHAPALAVPCAYFYSTMHYVITPVVLIWMYRRHRGSYRVARTALAISTLTSLLLFWIVPTAPPRLLRGAHVPDALFVFRHWGWWGGDGSVPRGLGGITNQVAAMPSLHVGWALWSGFLIARYAHRRVVRLLGVLYPLVTSYVVLATGNHYLADIVVGSAVMVFGAVSALGLRRLVRRNRSADPPATPPAHGPADQLVTASHAA